jgi:two-component system, LytTR family, response regulator
MTAIIIDDEQPAIDVLKIKLKRYCPQIEVIACSDDPIEGLGLVKLMKPDVLFLDVEMPELSGFELMKDLDLNAIEVIISTAHQHYSIKAIREDAFDFLQKPVDVNELMEVVARLMLKNTQKKQTPKDSPNWAKLQTEYNKIILPTGNGFMFSPINDIIRLESFGNYANVYMTSGQKILSNKSITDFENILQTYHFSRVHHSHLINLNHVLEYQKIDNIIVMKTNTQSTNNKDTRIPVSKRKKKDFLQLLSGK